MKQLVEQIEISKEGIKVSYFRYIAESSVGIAFCAYCFFLRYWEDEMRPRNIWEKSFLESIPLEYTIGLFIFALLTAPAIGVVISGIAYYALSWLEVVLLRRMFGLFGRLVPLAKLSNDVSTTMTFMNILPQGYLEAGYHLQRILEFHGSDKIRVNTRRTLMRNLTMLLIICFLMTMPLLTITGAQCAMACGILCVVVFFLSMVTALELYLQLATVLVVTYNYIHKLSKVPMANVVEAGALLRGVLVEQSVVGKSA